MLEDPPEVHIGADEQVWVTGDVHLSPDEEDRAAFFLRFLAEARRVADRLVILGDLFDYWVGPKHGRRCSYRPVIEAFEEARRDGYPIDFVAGNRDCLGPDELTSIGLTVHGDLVVYDRAGARTVVTHGDLLVKGDRSYKRYRRVVRSRLFGFCYWIVPVFFRLFVAWALRVVSRAKLGKLEPYAFPIDTDLSQVWLERLEAQDLLMGHLHREETHEHDEQRTTRMLPPWGSNSGPHFVLGPAAELRVFSSD